VAVFGVAPLPLKIAQPFMAGTCAGNFPKSRPGTKEPFCRPSRDFFILLAPDPAMNGWAIIEMFPGAVRWWHGKKCNKVRQFYVAAGFQEE
jgi:hypothetical protein